MMLDRLDHTEKAVIVNGHLACLELQVRPGTGQLACAGQLEAGPSCVCPVPADGDAPVHIGVIAVVCFSIIEVDQAG